MGYSLRARVACFSRLPVRLRCGPRKPPVNLPEPTSPKVGFVFVRYSCSGSARLLNSFLLISPPAAIRLLVTALSQRVHAAGEVHQHSL